jgi:hypothetical protein
MFHTITYNNMFRLQNTFFLQSFLIQCIPWKAEVSDIFFLIHKLSCSSLPPRCFLPKKNEDLPHYLYMRFFPRYIRNLRDVRATIRPSVSEFNSSPIQLNDDPRDPVTEHNSRDGTKDLSRIDGIFFPSFTPRITKLWWKLFSFDINLRQGFTCISDSNGCREQDNFRTWRISQ